MYQEKVCDAYLADILRRKKTGEHMTVLEEIVAKMANGQIKSK